MHGKDQLYLPFLGIPICMIEELLATGIRWNRHLSLQKSHAYRSKLTKGGGVE